MLEVRDLTVSFDSGDLVIGAINGLDLDLDDKESMAIIGESGSGKSVLASTILGILEENGSATGKVLFDGQDLMGEARRELPSLRGRVICLLPQNAWSAWDPLMRIGDQMSEFMRHCGIPAKRTEPIAEEMVRRCGLDPQVLRAFPHRLSGGMSQRAMIAKCMSVRPRLLIADEPTKGLDGGSRKLVLELMGGFSSDTSLLMITHDLRAARICDSVSILYAGRIVETGKTSEVLGSPRHPYTKGLCAAHPRQGMVPIPHGMGQRHDGNGCSFMGRCAQADDQCQSDIPLAGEGSWKVRCVHARR
jgi:peptide/nickel transport system ATP-binding protein